MTKANYTADWREGVSALQEKTDNQELLRYIRICEKWLEECFQSDDRSIIDMELAFRIFLKKQRRSDGRLLSGRYINNLMSYFRKIIDESPKKQFFHESAEAWREVFIQKNENSSVIPSSRAVEFFLAFIMTTGWDLRPLTAEEVAQFKTYLTTKGFDPHEGASNFARHIRRHLRAKNLFVDPHIPKFPVPKELEQVFEDMKSLALKGHRSSIKKRTLRQAMQGDDLQPILEKTWKKVSRDFSRFVHFLVDNRVVNLSSVNWSDAFEVTVITDYLDHRNQIEEGITKSTAETVLASISKSMVLLHKCGHLQLTLEKLKSKKNALWALNAKLAEVFDKKGVLDKINDGPGLPLYEDIYLKFIDYFQKKYAHILKQRAKGQNVFPKQRDLLTLIFEVEYGWRPNDLVSTLTVDCVSLQKTRKGQEFFFIKYIPAKTAWRDNPSKVTAPLAPWYSPFFKEYLDDLEKSETKLLVPTSSSASANRRMSSRISKLSYRVFKHSLSANSYRRIHASFFQRHSLPGLYLFTGRRADSSMSLQTEVELKVYAPGATTPEALLEVRYGKRIREILGIR